MKVIIKARKQILIYKAHTKLSMKSIKLDFGKRFGKDIHKVRF